MREYPVWFETGNFDADLTADGCEEVEALANLEIEQVVAQRFRDTPEKVRRAMVLASLVGNRFVVDLVERLAEAQFEAAARADLGEAESRYRFLRDVTDRSRNDIAAFSEGLFHMAAERYRTSGNACLDLADWPEDAALREALDDLLRQLVEDPATFATLSPEDRAEALALAVTRFEAEGGPILLTALGRQIETAEQRADYDTAGEAARHFSAKLFGSDDLESVNGYLADLTGQVLVRLGLGAQVDQLYQYLHITIERRAQADPSNVGWQRDLSVSHDRIGDSLAAQGRGDDALSAYRKALAIRERLAAADPSNAEWQRDLIVSHVKLAQLGDDTVSRYRAALGVGQNLAETGRLAPVDAWMLEDLAGRLAAAEAG